MALETTKQPRETTQSLVRRFTKSVKQSGILLRARKTRFHARAKSRNMRRKSALRREEKRKEYEKLIKLGLLEENRRQFNAGFKRKN